MIRFDSLERARRRSGYLLFAFALVLVGMGTGLRDPWPSDEPRFVLIAQEMLQSGQFLIPRRGGELYPDKPPIFIWLSALAISLTGSARLGFLLPSLLAGLGTLALVTDLVRRLHGQRIAWLAGVALLATVQFVLQAKSAQIDMVLTFFTTLGSYGLLRHALLGPAPGWWLIGWAAMGLGILTKGVGFLPLMMLPAWAWLAGKGRATRLTVRQLALGLLTAVAVVAAWGVPMIAVTTFGDPELASYRDNILFKQTGERYAASWHHLKPWYFYVVEVIPWAWMPLVLALPWAVPAWRRRVGRGDAGITLPLAGVLLILVFFSISPGKRGVYLLPAIPLLVIAMAPLLPGLLRKRGLQRAGGAVLAAFAATFLLGGVLGLAGHPSLAQVTEQYGIDPSPWLLLLGGTAAVLLGWWRFNRGMVGLVLWLPVFWTVWSTWGYVRLDPLRSPADLMARVAAMTGPGAWLAMPNFREEFLLQSRQPTVHFGRETPTPSQMSRAFDWLKKAPDQRWMLIEQYRREQVDCAALESAKDLGYQNRELWWLIPGTAFRNCVGSETAAPLFVAPTTMPGPSGR